jgi:Leucine-rich repeat (LRR) protein
VSCEFNINPNNNITNLDSLPVLLTELHCNNNQLTSLNNLPPRLEILSCNDNQLSSIDYLPDRINSEVFECRGNPFIYDFEPTLENIQRYNEENMKQYVLK